MNTEEFVTSVAARLGVDADVARDSIESIIGLIYESVSEGHKLTLTGFGSFEKRERQGHVVHNPRTGAKVRSKPAAVPAFKAGAEFRAIMSGAKKLPPASRRPHQGGGTSPAALPPPAKQPIASTPPVAAPKEAPRIASKPVLPPQVAPRPGFPTGFLPNPAVLTSGRLGGIPWSTIASRLTETLRAIDVDEVVLDVHVTRERAAIEFHIQRLVDVEPFWVAWVVDADPSLAHSLAASGWHAWPAEFPAMWEQPRYLIPLAGVRTANGMVLTWRANEPLSLVRAILGWLYDAIRLRDPIHIEARVIPVSSKELKRRLAELKKLEDAAAHASRRHGARREPTRGHCLICGHPLSDRESVRRGVGPECWATLRGANVRALARVAGIPLRAWPGAKPVKTWRNQLRRRLSGVAEATP